MSLPSFDEPGDIWSAGYKLESSKAEAQCATRVTLLDVMASGIRKWALVSYVMPCARMLEK